MSAPNLFSSNFDENLFLKIRQSFLDNTFAYTLEQQREFFQLLTYLFVEDRVDKLISLLDAGLHLDFSFTHCPQVAKFWQDQALFKMALTNSATKCMHFFIEKDYKFKNLTYVMGKKETSLIFLSFTFEQKELTKLLLQDPVFLHTINEDNENVLHCAVKSIMPENSCEILDYVLTPNFNKEYFYQRNINDISPFMLAVYKGNRECISRLISFDSTPEHFSRLEEDLLQLQHFYLNNLVLVAGLLNNNYQNSFQFSKNKLQTVKEQQLFVKALPEATPKNKTISKL